MCITGKPQPPQDLAPRQGVIAWRKFQVSDDGTRLEPAFSLGRASHPYCWAGRVAKAHKRPTGKTLSDVGLHAYARRAQINTPASDEVVGKVRLFGRVVTHRDHKGAVVGYLAEYAEIVGLRIDAHDGIAEPAVRRLAEQYKVKVLA
jgi:hypothetical protein